jgi:hypothetical protein
MHVETIKLIKMIIYAFKTKVMAFEGNEHIRTTVIVDIKVTEQTRI